MLAGGLKRIQVCRSWAEVRSEAYVRPAQKVESIRRTAVLFCAWNSANGQHGTQAFRASDKAPTPVCCPILASKRVYWIDTRTE